MRTWLRDRLLAYLQRRWPARGRHRDPWQGWILLGHTTEGFSINDNCGYPIHLSSASVYAQPLDGGWTSRSGPTYPIKAAPERRAGGFAP